MPSATPDTLWHAIPCGADANHPGHVLVSAAVSPAAEAQGAMPPVWQNWPDSVTSAFDYSVDFFDGNKWVSLDPQAKPVSTPSHDLWALLFPEGKAGAKQPARAPQPNVNFDLPPVTHRAGALHSNLNKLRGLLLMYEIAATMTKYEGTSNPVRDLVGDESTILVQVESALESIALTRYPKPQPPDPKRTLPPPPDPDQDCFERWIRGGLASADPLKRARARTAERNLYRLSARPYDNNLHGSVFRRIQRALDPGSVCSGPAVAATAFDRMVIGLRTQTQDASVFHGRSSPPPQCSKTPDTYDWTQKISLLGNYPKLLRLLGLVIDFSVPAPPNLEGQVRIVASHKHHTSLARNSATSTDKRFFAAAGSDDVLDRGALNLHRRVKLNDEFDDTTMDLPEYELIYLDADGDAIKMLQAADSRARSQGKFASSHTPELADDDQNVLPAARTAGLALVRNGHAAATMEKHQKDTTRRKNLENGGSELLFAADLVRGYIPEVRLVAREGDDRCGVKHTSQWLSLTKRHESFDGLNLPHASNNAMTCPGAPPPDFTDVLSILRWSATTTSDAPGGQPVDPDLHIHEVLFRWRGWSLSVPQPVCALREEECAKQQTFPFTLKTEVPPKSLPPLRFGTACEMRVRTMDMACKVSDDVQDLPSLKSKFLRYQPVSAPVVLLETPFKESDSPGEGVDLLLLRDGATADEKRKAPEPFRTLVPPRVNLEMAELHGCFDASRATPFSVGSFEAAKLVCPPQGSTELVCPPQGSTGHLDFPDDLRQDNADPNKQHGSGNKLYQPPTEHPPPGAYYPDPLADRNCPSRVLAWRWRLVLWSALILSSTSKRLTGTAHFYCQNLASGLQSGSES